MIIQSIKKIHTIIENLLNNARLVKGLGLTTEELKNETKLTYWRNFATTKGANEKDSYLVWNIENVSPMIYGDSQIINVEFSLKIMLFTRNYLINNEMEEVEEQALKSSYEFTFNSIEFNPEYRAYVYVFDIKGMI